MSYLLYQQLKATQLKATNDGGNHPLDGYEPDEVLISGPELLIGAAGLLITPEGCVRKGGIQPDRFMWNHRTDVAFATIAPMLQGIMFLNGGLGSSLAWRWKFRHGLLYEAAKKGESWEKESTLATLP